MTVTFYSNNADNRKVDKTSELTTLRTLTNVHFYRDENKGGPALELAYDQTIFEDANYCYIQELNHYYYMSEPTMSQQRITFSLTSDLLMTFKDDILDLECIIARQESEYNTYLNDNRLPVLNRHDVTTLLFPSGFSDDHYECIMSVNGGDNNA